MEEPSYCNLSLAVDCTLSLGSTTTSLRTAEIPARLSRAGSPDQDLTWSLAVRSDHHRAVVEDHPSSRARTCEPDEQAMSWGGSCCNRSDPDVSPDYYPAQVSETKGGRGSDGPGARSSGAKAWPRTSTSAHRASYKDDVKTSKALFSMINSQSSSYGHRSSRQPGCLSSYIPSTVVEVKAATSRVEQCMQEGESFVRVCAHCGTSKTPLWRNGPGGPKSLCNACGIRFKKAGRRSAANGNCDLQLSPPSTPKAATKRKLASEDQQYWIIPPESTAKPRKRSRGSDSLLSGSCMTWQSCLLTSSPGYKSTSSLQRDSSRARSPQEKNNLNLQMGSYSSDEEEGAVLLMALSCGMVNA